MADANAAEKVVPIAGRPEEDVISSADELLGENDVEYKVIDAWGKKIRLQSLTAGDIIEWSEAGEGEAKRTAGLRLIIKSVVDAQGKPLFTTKHLPMLKLKNHKQSDKVVEEIIKLNGLQVKGVDLKKD